MGILALWAACGPTTYIRRVTFTASDTVDAASHAEADCLSPYELYSAEAYLLKAREEAGYSEWQVANELGRSSARYGEEAERRARRVAAQPLGGQLKRTCQPRIAQTPTASSGQSEATP
jgi:hypothetical protein